MEIGAPYWAFAWAGGQALARHLLDHPAWVAGRNVFSFGAGSGLEAIASKLAGASRVMASDIDPVATCAIAINGALNGVEIEVTGRDVIGEPLDGFDLVLAGDVLYERAFAERVLSWLHRLADRGRSVLLGDPFRGFVPSGMSHSLLPIATYEAPADVDHGGVHTRRTGVFELRA
jgi:predicted nicotinamide N-methyase